MSDTEHAKRLSRESANRRIGEKKRRGLFRSTALIKRSLIFASSRFYVRIFCVLCHPVMIPGTRAHFAVLEHSIQPAEIVTRGTQNVFIAVLEPLGVLGGSSSLHW